MGAAAALANLALLRNPTGVDHRRTLQNTFAHQLNSLWTQPSIGDIRHCGLVAGIELVRDWRTRTPFDLSDRVGIRVCEAMARRGVLTRPIGNVLVLMPPYCTTSAQVHQMVAAVAGAITEVLGKL